jgi:endogenous inhibitor of DNA gyrase (YacG/DUF329 family)
VPDPSELVVVCPRCRQRGKWFADKWGPFCSKRCRLIDLGQWFNEEHTISRELRPGDFEGFDELPPDSPPDRA